MLHVFYVYTSEGKKNINEVMSLIGSITKILRTLQLAIFSSSSQIFFYRAAIDFPSLSKLHKIIFYF